MTKRQARTGLVDLKALLQRDEDYLRAMVQSVVQATLEAEMAEAIGAEKGERTETRLSYRSGYYRRSLVTRVGTVELGESLGGGSVGDVRAGGFRAEGQGCLHAVNVFDGLRGLKSPLPTRLPATGNPHREAPEPVRGRQAQNTRGPGKGPPDTWPRRSVCH